MEIICPVCNGSGLPQKRQDAYCDECGGEGTLEVKEELLN